MKTIKLSDITWGYSVDYQTSIPIIINNDETKFWDLRTQYIYPIPENTTLKQALEQRYTIKNIVVCSSTNMINEFSSSSLRNMIISPTIRNLEFSKQLTYDYCETHKVSFSEINTLTKIFNRSLHAKKLQQKRLAKQMQEEDVRSF